MVQTALIDGYYEALKRIVAGLVAMAALTEGTAMSRHLHAAVLRTLRPAEAAARRIIILMAQGLIVEPPKPRRKPAEPQPDPRLPQQYIKIHPSAVAQNARQTGMVLPRDTLREMSADGVLMYLVPNPHYIAPVKPEPRRRVSTGARGQAAFQLLDPPWRFHNRRRKYVPDHLAPRVLSLDRPHEWKQRLSPVRSETVDATRLGQRLTALNQALGDMPAQAQRYALWHARRAVWQREQRAASMVQTVPGQARKAPRRNAFRYYSLRRGRPPGCRLPTYNLDAKRHSNIREIDEILSHLNALATYALRE